MGFWGGRTLTQFVTQSVPYDRSAYVKSGPVAFNGISVKTNGVNDVVFSVYDSTSAAGTLLLPADFTVPGTANLWVLSIPIPLIAWTGIFVEMTGNGSYQILYDEG